MPGPAKIAQPAPAIDVLDAVRTMFRRDSIYMVIAAFQTILAVLVTPVITRLLGVAEFGQVATATALLQVLVAVANLGLQVAVQRDFFGEDGRRRARGLLAAGLLVTGLTTIVIFVSGPLWAPIIGFRQFTTLIRLVVIYGGTAAGTQLGLAMLRCAERTTAYALVSTLQSVGGQLLGIIFLLTLHRTATCYVLGLASAQVVALILTLILAPPRWPGRAAAKRLGHALRFSVPLVPQQVAAFVIVASDRFVVQAYKGSIVVGRYQVAYNIGSLAIILLTFLSGAWTARIFSIKAESDRLLVIARSRDTLYGLLLPVTLGIGFGSGLVLRYWVPSSYHVAGLPIVISLVDVATFPAWSAANSQQALLATGRTKAMAASTGSAAALNLVLNLILVPPFGIIGSAIATLASYIFQAFVSNLLARRAAISRLRPPRRLTLTLLGVGVATIATGALPLTPAGTWVRVAGSIVCLASLGNALHNAGTHGPPGQPRPRSRWSWRERQRDLPPAMVRVDQLRRPNGASQ